MEAFLAIYARNVEKYGIFGERMETSIFNIVSSEESAEYASYKKGEGHITIQWCWDKGYGNIFLIVKNGKLLIDAERMDKDFVKLVLCKLVEDAELIG